MEFRKSANMIVLVLLAAPWLTSCVTPCGASVTCVEAQPCTSDATSGLHSLPSYSNTQIEFINDSNQLVKIFWIDFAGRRVPYNTLAAGASYVQLTYLSHPWVVTDAEANLWHIYYADSQPRTVHITGPG
jgi:hypothetical protein